MIMMMMMMMTMMTNTIPYRRTKSHIWDKVLMGIWVHPIIIIFNIIMFMISIILTTKIILTKTVTNAKYHNQWAADFTARLLALIRFNILFILNNIEY